MCKHPMPKGLRFAILQKTIRRQMDEYVRETGLTGTQVGVLGELRIGEGLYLPAGTAVHRRSTRSSRYITANTTARSTG